jgi:hypothetical protein
MSVLGAVVDGILAMVSQRPFMTAAQIKELVRRHNERAVEKRYGGAEEGTQAVPSDDLRAMRIFVTDQQQTWLVVVSRMAYCVLDDRRREEPQIQWWTNLESVLDVRSDESWSTEAGVLHFGCRSKGWLYSKELFPNEPPDVAISHFLAGNDG